MKFPLALVVGTRPEILRPRTLGSALSIDLGIRLLARQPALVLATLARLRGTPRPQAIQDTGHACSVCAAGRQHKAHSRGGV